MRWQWCSTSHGIAIITKGITTIRAVRMITRKLLPPRRVLSRRVQGRERNMTNDFRLTVHRTPHLHYTSTSSKLSSLTGKLETFSSFSIAELTIKRQWNPSRKIFLFNIFQQKFLVGRKVKSEELTHIVFQILRYYCYNTSSTSTWSTKEW